MPSPNPKRTRNKVVKTVEKNVFEIIISTNAFIVVKTPGKIKESLIKSEIKSHIESQNKSGSKNFSTLINLLFIEESIIGCSNSYSSVERNKRGFHCGTVDVSDSSTKVFKRFLCGRQFSHNSAFNDII